MNNAIEFKFNGSVKFVAGKMVTTYDILDGDTVVSTFSNTTDCNIEDTEVVPEQPVNVFTRIFKSGGSKETFSSGIWTILLKDVLKTIGGVLVAQIKKKVEEKIKEKFKSDDEESDE